MKRIEKEHNDYANGLWRRCILLFAGMVFFMILAAVRAKGGEYQAYGEEWRFPDEDMDDVMSADDHLLSMRMKKRMTSQKPVYSRIKASRIHDSVTIIVKEDTSGELTSQNDLKRNSSNDMTITNWLTPSFNNGLRFNQRGKEAGGNTPTLAYNTNRQHKSDSSVDKGQSFTTTITGTVVEVLPNRYLVVQARKTVAVNGESQTLILTGTVNPDHLDSNSQINANFIMDMNVAYSGKGPMTRMDKRPWGAKIWDFITPF